MQNTLHDRSLPPLRAMTSHANSTLPWLLGISIASVAALLLGARSLLSVVTVTGVSMCPTYQPGDRLLVLRHWPARWLRRRSVILTLFRSPGIRYRCTPRGSSDTPFVKRIVGMPGDVVVVHISELPDFLRPRFEAHYDSAGLRTWVIPAHHYFVRGDSQGHDSTVEGPIPFRCFRGLVLIGLVHRDQDVRADSVPSSGRGVSRV